MIRFSSARSAVVGGVSRGVSVTGAVGGATGAAAAGDWGCGVDRVVGLGGGGVTAGNGSAIGADATCGSSDGAITRGGGAGTASGGPSGTVWARALAQLAPLSEQIPKPKTQNPKPNPLLAAHARPASERPTIRDVGSGIRFGVWNFSSAQLTRGSRTLNVVPRPGVDCTSISPSCS